MRTQLRGSRPREQCRRRLGRRSRGLLGEALSSPRPWQRWALTLIIQQTRTEHLLCAKHCSGCWGHSSDHSGLKAGACCGDEARQGGEVGGRGHLWMSAHRQWKGQGGSPRGEGRRQAGTWGRVCEGGWARPLRNSRKMDRDGDGVGPVCHGQ